MPVGKPDAVLIPPALRDRIGAVTLGAQIKATLGRACHFCKDWSTGMIYARWLDVRNEDPTVVYSDNPKFFPSGHPLQSQPRHDWYVAEQDGLRWVPAILAVGDPCEAGQMLLGYLKPDPHAETAETRAALAAALVWKIDQAKMDEALARFAAETEAASRKKFDEVNPDDGSKL